MNKLDKYEISTKLYRELKKLIKNKILIKITEDGLIINISVNNKMKVIKINITNEEIKENRITQLANIIEARSRRLRYVW